MTVASVAPRAAQSQDKKKATSPKVAASKENDMATVTKLEPRVQRDLSFIQEGFVEFSAVQANTVLMECPFDGQRKIGKDHVKVLADMMKRDKWEAKDKLDFAMLHGQPILVNGYHRMHAQVSCGKAIRWTVVIHQCATMDQVRNLYYRFDTNTRLRAPTQILNAVDFAERNALSKTMAQALYRAVPLIANDFSDAPKDRDILTAKVTDRRIAFAKEYLQAAQKYEEAISGSIVGFKSKFYSAGVCAVALVTFRFQPIAAMEFWTGVALNDGLRRGDPRQTLNNYLTANSVRGNGGRITRSAFGPSIAWNAYYDERELQIIKIYEGREISIDGTPWERA